MRRCRYGSLRQIVWSERRGGRRWGRFWPLEIVRSGRQIVGWGRGRGRRRGACRGWVEGRDRRELRTSLRACHGSVRFSLFGVIVPGLLVSL